MLWTLIVALSASHAMDHAKDHATEERLEFRWSHRSHVEREQMAAYKGPQGERGWISEKCLGAQGCEALRVLPTIRVRAVQTDGGQNPGAVLCSKHLGGTVRIGIDPKGNQQSFCRFADGSMIDNGTLMRAMAAGLTAEPSPRSKPRRSSNP